MSRDLATVLQIVQAARQLRSYTHGFDRQQFGQDSRTRSAVLYQLLVIGEAAKRLSPDFTTQHGAIPWRAVAGMRDKLIHGYDAVDVDEVWRTVETDVPTLLRVLSPLVPGEESPAAQPSQQHYHRGRGGGALP